VAGVTLRTSVVVVAAVAKGFNVNVWVPGFSKEEDWENGERTEQQ
jgi:hypothetical protein